MKVSREEALWISTGRDFQRVGTATLKAWSPKIRRQEQGMERRSKSEDRKVQDGV